MSKPYNCGHTNEDEHDDYCGVGACYVCMMRAERDGFPPHGVVMEAERTLEVRLAGYGPGLGVLFRNRVCGDCGMREAMSPYFPDAALVETFS